MNIYDLNDFIELELKKGQTIDNLVDYVLCDFNMTRSIITKHFGMFGNVRGNTKRRLVKDYIVSIKTDTLESSH